MKEMSYINFMDPLRGAFAALLGATALFAQTTPSVRPEFEVASIKRAEGPIQQVSVGVHVDGAQVHCSGLSLKDYIRIAYRLKLHQIVGPEWLAAERFNIHATIPAGMKREQVPEMLQSLLESRFQMSTHHDSKEIPVYALVPIKGGAKLKEAEAATGDTSEPSTSTSVTVDGGPNGTSVNFGKGSYFTFSNNKIEFHKMTMPNIADMLARFVERPIVDMTELTGQYDVILDIPPEDFRAMMIRGAVAAGVSLPPEVFRLLDNASDDSLFQALQAHGLKLEARKAPVTVLVVDRIQRVPTEN